MNKNDLNTLLDIVKSKLDNGSTLEEIKKFIITTQNENVFSELKNDIENYIQSKQDIQNKIQKHWMLICNPATWGHEDGDFIVNELLKDLHNNEDGEWWKINDKTNMELKMKVGHKGIIKVSDDSRSQDLRTDEDDRIVPILESGIYGVFEIIEDFEGDFVVENEYGEHFVHIKMIDNYFDQGINISKEESRKLISESIYNSQSSRELDKNLFDRVIKYIEEKRS
jgi:hypothetical protein